MGAIYAAHLGFAEDIKIYIIEEHSTREYRGLAPTSTPLQLFVSAHAHAAAALAVVAASPYYMGMVFVFGLGLTAPLFFPPAVFTAPSFLQVEVFPLPVAGGSPGAAICPLPGAGGGDGVCCTWGTQEVSST
jgi:hypothetical protein